MIVGQNTSKFFTATETLDRFLKDVRGYELLTTEKEESLLRDYKNGNAEAWNDIVCGNLRFIYSIAKNYYATNEYDVLDYVNEGVIGLYQALEKFDVSKGFKFITYAVWYIRRSMNYYLNTTRNVIIRSNVAKYGKKIDKLKNDVYLSEGREPNEEEVIELMKKCYDIDIKDINDVYNLSISSIDAEIDEDYTIENNPTFNNATSTFNEYENVMEEDYKKKTVSEILNLIPQEWQRDMIKMLNGIGYDREYSVEEVSEKYNMRPLDVMQLKDKIYSYIRQNYSRVAI